MERSQRNELIDIAIQHLQHAKTSNDFQLEVKFSEVEGPKMALSLWENVTYETVQTYEGVQEQMDYMA